eukprot:TRINITY_DN6566_c0_g1_i1.p1 TRINITY_DN6566_c0_g1~~TRINITY_DN6566_c0_g1_i1.p1  ORF type:complete len:282 (+),score=59.52 TRINITY_DN6566_c0_g1_i1:102-947(+)
MAEQDEVMATGPLSDLEVHFLVLDISQHQLSSDQRNLAASRLGEHRTLTCAQAGHILGPVQHALTQRNMACQLFRGGRLSDAPEGLPDLLHVLPATMRQEVAKQLGGQRGLEIAKSLEASGADSTEPVPPSLSPLSARPSVSLLSSRATTKASASSYYNRAELDRPVERLKDHVRHGEVSEAVYQDLAAVFAILGLGELPPQPADARQPVGVSYRQMLPSLPSLPLGAKDGMMTAHPKTLPSLPPGPIFALDHCGDASCQPSTPLEVTDLLTARTSEPLSD